MKSVDIRLITGLMIFVGIVGCGAMPSGENPATSMSQLPDIKSAADFNMLAGVTSFQDIQDPAIRSDYLAALLASADAKAVITAMAASQCSVGPEQGVVTRADAMVVVSIPAHCSDGADSALSGLLYGDGTGRVVVVGEIISLTEESSPYIKIFEAMGGHAIEHDISEAELAQILAQSDDSSMNAAECGSAAAGVSCAAHALHLPNKCDVCKFVVGKLLLRGDICGWFSKFVACGGLGLLTVEEGGLGGAVCLVATSLICKVGVSQVKQRGATYVCRRAKVAGSALCR